MSWRFCKSPRTFHFFKLLFLPNQLRGSLINGIFPKETIWWIATGWPRGCYTTILLQMCFESIYSIYFNQRPLNPDLSNWFSALTSISSRLTNLHSRSSDLTCRRSAVSNLYVSSAIPRPFEWQVSSLINEESKDPFFEKIFSYTFCFTEYLLNLRGQKWPRWGLLGSCSDREVFWSNSY